VLWTQRSADGRAARSQEWKLVETFRRPVEVAASAPENGSIGMVFTSSDDIAEAQGDCDGTDERLHLDHVWVTGQRPVLLSATRNEALTPESDNVLALSDENNSSLKLHLPGALPEGVQKKMGILARNDGTLWTVEDLDTPGPARLKRYDSPTAAVRATLNLAGDAAKARATALGWATAAALRSRRNTLILWGQPSEERLKSLVELDSANYELASSFWIHSSEIRLEEPGSGEK
jgi:hypothetical protein